MKKTIVLEVCDGCEEEYDGYYLCSECGKKYCEECILEHVVEEKFIKFVETDKE